MSKEVKRYDPLAGLARNAKLRRMEMQCDPQWVLDLLAERDRLREALEELITWIPSADTYRRLGFDPEAPMRALDSCRACL